MVLPTPDVAAASVFYGSVLGWTLRPVEDPPGGHVLAELTEVGELDDGGSRAAVAGLGPLPPDSGPSAWVMSFATGDIDATAADVTRLGGALLLPPSDAGTLGRLAVAADPTGAVFGLWQAGTHTGVQVVNEPGAFSWDDLRSTDPGVARAFYRDLFGFVFTEIAPDLDYTTYGTAEGEPPLGGIGGMFDAPGPSQWLVCFGVDDADEAAGATTVGGGTVRVQPHDTPYGRIAELADPFGAAFNVITVDAATMPDRSD